MSLTYPIATERLFLRPYQMTDLDDMHAFYSREDVARYLYTDAQNRETCHKTLQQKIAQNHLSEEKDKLVLAVELRNENKVIGEVLLIWKSKQHRTAEIGYIFHPEHQGLGYASEAATALLKLGFETFNFHRIFARCDARNTGSFQLMERLGMRREAHLIQNEFIKGEWTDELEYAILREEWERKQK